MSKNLKKSIEAILFVAGSPVSLNELKKSLEVEEQDILNSIEELKIEMTDRGVILTESNKTYQLATHPDVSPYIKNYLQAQLREKLTEAALETLSIIAYKQPVSRAEIEAIRGVNCQYVLRLLSQRGLIEKTHSSTDARVLLYQTTHEFLHHLGLKDIKELPDFDEISKNINLPQSLNQEEKTE